MNSRISNFNWLNMRFGPASNFGAFGALTCLTATLCGMLAATGNFVLIGAAFVAIVAPFLLVRTDKVLTLVIVAGIGGGAIISILGPSFTVISWLISLLSFSLLPLPIFLLYKRPKTCGFIWLTIAFIVYSAICSLMQWHTLDQLIAGTKRYYQGLGVLFTLAFVSFAPSQILRWKTNLVALAFLQLPFAIWEFVVLVPLRGGLDAGGEATDVVAGTFGANLEGGSANAEMSAFVLIVFIFFLARWRAGLISRGRALIICSLCLAPLALGETKIVVILLPIMVLTLLRKGFMKDPWRHSASIATCALLTVGLAYVYITIMDRNTVSESIDLLTQYNMGDVGYGGNILNRMTVLTFWWDRHSLSDPVSILFGHGLGSSFWGDNSPIPGHIAVLYPNYGIGLTTASTLLWDLGALGLVLHLAIFVGAWIAANKLWSQTPDKSLQTEALAIQASIACFVLFIFYRDSGVNLLAYEVVVGGVLGYLAYLCRITSIS
jgi:hypothetical protein